MRAQGTSYGAPCELENVLAKIVIDRVPCLEMVRFVNSGTEACLSVLRLMRAFTGRDKARSLLLASAATQAMTCSLSCSGLSVQCLHTTGAPEDRGYC
jgi:acetylornithine/succinyldiaminopimelate/putrescine aminotransferase